MRREVARQKFESSHALQYPGLRLKRPQKRIGMMARARCRAVQAEHGAQLGCTLSQDGRLAHERSTSSEMNKIRCQTRRHTVRQAQLNAGLAVGHPKYPRECTLPSYRFHHVAARSCTRAKPELAAAALTHLRHFSKPSLGEKAFETEPPIVFFPLDPKKRHLQWATWWVFGSSETGGLSEDPKKRHQKLRKPAKLRLCRSQALLPLAWCFQDAGKSKVQEVPCLRTLRIRLRVRPKFPPLRRA